MSFVVLQIVGSSEPLRGLDIYRRILDARRSRRQKDEAEERKSMTAKRDVSLGSDALPEDLGERELDLNSRIRDAMNDDFDPEYMRLIRGYFESLLGETCSILER